MQIFRSKVYRFPPLPPCHRRSVLAAEAAGAESAHMTQIRI